jgi:uncharacterized protein YkwD
MFAKTKRQSIQNLRKVLAITLGALVVFAGFLGWQLLEPANNGSRFVSATERSSLKEQIVLATNNERINAGLAPLKDNNLLSTAAQKKAEDMVSAQYFSHIRPTDSYKWSDFIDEQKYDYRFAGENLAKGYTSVDMMVKAWMNSPSHKENILSADFAETGVGFAFKPSDAGDVLYVAQMFGTQY